MTRIYRVLNSKNDGPLIFANDEADALSIAVAERRVRNPAKAKIKDVTDGFAHPREKTDRALASGHRGIAYYRLTSFAKSPGDGWWISGNMVV